MVLFQKKKNYLPILITIVFAIFFCLESLVNHCLLRTHALDLGMANNALYDFARGKANQCTLLFETDSQNFLSCHFSLYPVILSPFSYLLGSYTLLIFQIASILWGGWGVYTYFKWKSSKPFLPALAMLHFFLIWAIYSALSFDYHDNVIAAMLVPWIIYYFEKERYDWTTFYIIFLIIAKENMALWASFIAAGLLLIHWKNKTQRIYAIILFISSLTYFIFILKFMMPFLGKGSFNETSQLSSYDSLGNSLTDIAFSIIRHPKHFFTVFFANTTGNTVYNGIKAELFIMFVLAGGWSLAFKPHYFLMLVPVFAQKMLSNDYGRWGINIHYSIEFVPILTLASFTFLSEIKNNVLLYVSGVFLILSTGISTMVTFNSRKSKWYEETDTVFFRKPHYETNISIAEFRKVILLIPGDAILSTHSNFIPHLALRDKIYCFPKMQDAKYILIPTVNAGFPLWPQTKEQYLASITAVLKSDEWKTIYKSQNFWVFMRR